MKAYYYISSITDLVRTNNTPRIKETEKELCTDMDDFRFCAFIRFLGIKKDYPTAELHNFDRGAYVLVDGVLVYSLELIAIDPNPVEVED